jgi:hypothetical protein
VRTLCHGTYTADGGAGRRNGARQLDSRPGGLRTHSRAQATVRYYRRAFRVSLLSQQTVR